KSSCRRSAAPGRRFFVVAEENGNQTHSCCMLAAVPDPEVAAPMLDVFDPPYMQRALLEVALLSVAAGLLGTWIVLRGLAFFAHAAGTAAFPGLVLADGLGFAAPLGAFATALLFAGGVSRLAGGTPAETPGARRGGYDSVTALVLVGCLALGVILASDVFHSGSGVEGLLFGSVLLVDRGDLVLAAAASVLALAATWSLGPRWLARGFDPAAARTLGAGAEAL